MLLAKRSLFDDIFDTLDPFGPLSQRPQIGPFMALDAGIRRSSTEDELILNVDLPGAKKDTIELTFENNGILRINSRRADLQLEATHRCSISSEWDRDSADASLEDGVLTIRLKKLEKAKPKKLLIK
jgi:HSP20 family molecular chaperone IbpA